MKSHSSPVSPNRPKIEFITFAYITGTKRHSSRDSAKRLKPFYSPPQELSETKFLEEVVPPEQDRERSIAEEAFDIFVGLDELAAFEREASAGLEQILTTPQGWENPAESDPFFGQMGRNRMAIQGLKVIAYHERRKPTTELDEIDKLTSDMPPTPDEIMDFVDNVKADLERLPNFQAPRGLRRAVRALIRKI
jgi:hypothetical protein